MINNNNKNDDNIVVEIIMILITHKVIAIKRWKLKEKPGKI